LIRICSVEKTIFIKTYPMILNAYFSSEFAVFLHAARRLLFLRQTEVEIRF